MARTRDCSTHILACRGLTSARKRMDVSNVQKNVGRSCAHDLTDQANIRVLQTIEDEALPGIQRRDDLASPIQH